MYSSGYTWYDTRNVTTTTLIDRGPSAFNATMSTVIPSIPGPYRDMRGLAFSGGNTITCPTGHTSGDFSISYWIYLIDKVNSGGTTSYQYILTGGRVQLHQYFVNANIAYNSGGTVAFSQTGGVWTHLTYVYTTSGTTNITVYKNGIQVATANTSINAAGSFIFGNAGLTFISYLAEIRVVPFKLTANQALLFYNSYLTGEWAVHPTQTIPTPIRLLNQVVVRQTTTFLGTGAVQTFTVPAGVFQIRFFIWGAGGIGQNGNTNSSAAASGAFVEGTLLTTPGTVYSIIVGRPGQTGLANGGGTTGGTGAGGGGFSGIFSGSPAVATVIAIAGGGGGSGFNGNGVGGAGGFPNGFNGIGASTQGGGGTQTAAGISYGSAAGQLAGGNGAGGDGGGGGGGGGWWGGGGGTGQRAGGGGSSTYISSVINPVTFNGVNGGGAISPTPAANQTSPYWSSPLGSGGQNGLVVIGFNPFAGVTNFNSLRMSPRVPTTTQTFDFTGGNQTFTVPAGIVFVYVYMWGAGGGGINGNGGAGNGAAGAMVQGVLKVLPGQVLTIVVGGGGNTTAAASFGGGGTGGNVGNGTSGSGGGRSAIQINSSDVVTAGGGGGCGYPSNTGGAASFSGTANSGSNPTSGSGTGGGGGTQTSGGTAGANFAGSAVSSGSQFTGGNGGGQGAACGGGGGGGWFGGGGGGSSGGSQAGGGGGGSSYINNLQLIPGQSVFGFNSSGGNAAPNTSSPYYTGTIGRGGIIASTAGGNGRVVIVY